VTAAVSRADDTLRVPGTAAAVLDRVSAGYDDRRALDAVSLVVEHGALLAVVGPNGAGKSTLLKVLAGLIRPVAGSVTVLGRPATAAHSIAYVPQAEEVDWDFPVTVAAVVMMGRYGRIGIGRSPGREDRDRVAAALESVGVAHLADRQIGALSGGQRRRVFLARALAVDPELYLLDEPVTGVDVRTQDDMMDVLQAQAQAGRTVIATTHDLLTAAHRFDQAVLLNGRVIAHGPASLVLDERLLAETYAGHVVVLPGGSGLALDDAHHGTKSDRHSPDRGTHR
jgi:ABC-type Mn2+/Zn2+ transport system ATPase subunit